MLEKVVFSTAKGQMIKSFKNQVGISARKEEGASTLADTEKGKSMTLTNAPIVEEFDPVKVRED